MPADSDPEHHARRRQRRRRVKQLRQRPLGDLGMLPSFLTDAIGSSSDVVTATAAELGPLLDGAGYKIRGPSTRDDMTEDANDGQNPSLRWLEDE